MTTTSTPAATTRTLRIIGIGPGDPRQVTVEAIDAMRGVDTFFVLDKGATKESLVAVREQICDRHLGAGNYRFVEIEDPPRDRNPTDYDAEVRRWHDARATRIEAALSGELSDDGVGGILVWGDPGLYDSTLRIADAIVDRGRVSLRIEVVAGVTSASALTAAHRILMNRIGEPILITTGRRLGETPPGVDANQIVMLDADCTFRHTADPGDHIWWGAYLGTPDEILLSGTVGEVGEQIATTRAQARARHGWIMDIYLVRKP
ncbi:precorrin-6A synthase (deacetylating) [Williamsia sp.]|uniref:precorrin-6A synthase (deacetylating) n=1 Tax=Williamsia sp. TaxID=1872085 RepID=UPI0025E63E7A|nr:precorrin-6A synthase (deacetylating) [Williamsia sp.]